MGILDRRPPGHKVADLKFPVINTDTRSPLLPYMRLGHPWHTRSPTLGTHFNIDPDGTRSSTIYLFTAGYGFFRFLITSRSITLCATSGNHDYIL